MFVCERLHNAHIVRVSEHRKIGVQTVWLFGLEPLEQQRSARRRLRVRKNLMTGCRRRADGLLQPYRLRPLASNATASVLQLSQSCPLVNDLQTYWPLEKQEVPIAHLHFIKLIKLYLVI